MRKTALRRRTPLKSKTRVKPVNAKRKKANWARAYGSDERVEFVASLPCVVQRPSSPCAGTIENAHVANGGRGRKADADRVAPICTAHHQELHQIGQQSFEARYGVDLKVAARITEMRWQIASGGVRLVEQRVANDA